MARTAGTSSAPAASYQTQPVLTAVIAERRAANSLRDAAVAMAARATRKAQMHKKSAAVVVPALFVAAILVSTSASAYHKVSIGGTVSRGQLLKDCDAVGGLCGNCKGTTGAYSCTNTNNPGGETSVNCTSGGKCTGYVPRKSSPSHTIGGILHSPVGIKSSGSETPPRSRHRPVSISAFKPPSRMKTTGGNNTTVTIGHVEHHSGGHR